MFQYECIPAKVKEKLREIFIDEKDKVKQLREWRKIFDKRDASLLKLYKNFKFMPQEMTSVLPRFSFMLQLRFKLRKPYISRDDSPFHPLDNPIRKEKVFKLPMVAPSQWKGALRAAMVRALVAQFGQNGNSHEFAERRFHLSLLFGSEKGEEDGVLKGMAEYLEEIAGEESGRDYRRKVREYFGGSEDESWPHWRGRLYFYPTFFENESSLEVINPHNRKTGASARGPILMECVPIGSEGDFTLLYVPFGPRIGDDSVIRSEVARHLEMVAEGVNAMFTSYGFGAKSSSGFGVAEEELSGEGKLFLKGPRPECHVPEKFSPLLDEKGRPIEVLVDDSTGKLLSKTQFKKLKERKPEGLTNAGYEDFKKWYEEYGAARASGGIEEIGFDSFSKLVELAQKKAKRLEGNRQ